MMQDQRNIRYFLFYLPLCMLISVVLYAILARYIKREIISDFKGMEFTVDSSSEFNAELYYTYDDQFSSHKLKPTKVGKGSFLFKFPNDHKLIKRFRLDLGNMPKKMEVKITKLRLLFRERTIVLEEDAVFNSIFLNSSAVFLDKDKRIIYSRENVKPYDPYLIFAPLGALVMPIYLRFIVLLLPFFCWGFFYMPKRRSDVKPTILGVLTLLFILCIPLKIAWTTFCTILLCIYGIYLLIKEKRTDRKSNLFIFYICIFSFFILFGRPSELSLMNIQLALPLFAILSVSVIYKSIDAHLKNYVFFFLLFNAIILTAGINFLLWFHNFYGLGIMDYFSEIKIYSGNVREWLFYDHAAFLSYFGLVGLLFANELYKQSKIPKEIYYLYNILMFLFIIVVGARIALLVFLVFRINFILKLRPITRITLNGIIFGAVASLLYLNIDKIDLNRYHLWSVSWEAIKERPWFGYGLETSNAILHDPRFMERAGFSIPLNLNHSHNQFLTFVVEMGFIGTFCFFAALVYFLYKERLFSNTTMVLFVYGLGYIFLTESILQTSKPLYVICFLFLLIVQGNAIKKEKNVHLKPAI